MRDLAFAGSIFAFTARGLSLEVPTGQASAFARDVTAAAEDVYGESITVPENLPLWITEDGRPYLRVDAATDACPWAWATPFKTNLDVLYEGIERGRAAGSNQILWSITDGARYLRVISSGGYWSLVHHNGSGSVASTVASAPASGQRFRLRARFGKLAGRVQLSQSLYDADAGTWGEWEEAEASGSLTVTSWSADARISLRETGHSGNSDTAVLLVNRGEEVAEAPPDAVDLAVAALLARPGRTLTFHARGEAERRGITVGGSASLNDTMPDIGGNGRYAAQSTGGSRPVLDHDGERFVIDNATGKWMSIFEADDDTTKYGDLFSALAGSVLFVISGIPVGDLFANPVIGNAPHHMYFNATGPKIGFQFGGTTVEVAYVSGSTVAGIYRRGSGVRKFITDAQPEATTAGSDDITSILGSVVQLFRRADDSVAAPSVKLVFLQTENVRVADADVAPIMALLQTIKE